ncbi:hypothetical protein AJ80_04215 [Polytolypa hystricis UAMH7299]|uniref:Uncharacterized protein n=1 Tax=Polytolypa hystricis (strain UAMH7299) TaxID=1447883 RepID=A0A2B7YEU6_POLH7|nr:hypothetical protein AJ80_04215 [Polytolypa hystricis UAMH7299]
MAYINGIRAFGDRSEKRSQVKNTESTEKWSNALKVAEKAHWLLREAAVSAQDGKYEEAEKMAEDGVEQLKLSVSELPAQRTYETPLASLWDGSKCLEDAFPNQWTHFF